MGSSIMAVCCAGLANERKSPSTIYMQITEVLYALHPENTLLVITSCLCNPAADSLLCLERKVPRSRMVGQKIKASAELSASLELTAACKAVRLASKLCQV